MAAEEENKFAAFGKPLEPFDEEDVPKKKPVRPEDQIVTDEKGRRRFHGAFTGGFSAGYFNSVGSQEGWAPSTFLSSRSQRNVQSERCPEDFMDSEDTGVFGIAPRTIHTTKMFTAPEHEKNKRKRTNAKMQENAFLFEDKRFKDLVVPLNNSIGVKLLYKMGWKHGQGIGPKVKKNVKKVAEEEPQTNVKVYGCSLPPTAGVDSDDEFDNFTYAPKDVDIAQYVPKENLQGLGYQGLDKHLVLTSKISLLGNLSSTPATKKPVGIQGQAFGVGAFEVDDDDIYSVEDMSNYNFEETAAAKEATKKKVHDIKALKNLCKILEGFQLATKPSPVKKHFPLPNLPNNFKPFHQPKKTDLVKVEAKTDAKTESNHHTITSSDRGIMLAEEIPGGSVFNFIAPHDRARLDSIRESIKKESQEKKPDTADNLIAEEVLPKTTVIKVEPDDKSKPGPIKAGEFKPFATDTDKQQRYERYLASGSTDTNISKPLRLTEWEKVREKEEFQKASQLYRPLAAGMASRFVSANSLEQDDDAKQLPPVIMTADKTDMVKAVEMKMFGTLTRTKVAWYPHKLLCRRFNVPNPYPDSSMVGVEKEKKEKFSIFNFLTAGTLENASNQQENRESSKPAETKVDNTDRLLESAVKDQEMEIDQVPENKTNEKVNDKEAERPPMDLFKAIFQDTSEESSSENEDNEISQMETNIPETEVESTLQPETKNGLSESTEQSNSHTARARGSRWGPTNETLYPDVNAEPEISEDITYGPKLPPPTTEIPLLSNQDEKKKHKHDKNKRKHKKHKKHKKKRKYTSGSNSESESNSVEEINPEAILDRLKSIKKKTHHLL